MGDRTITAEESLFTPEFIAWGNAGREDDPATVSPQVAQEMLTILGDNSYWTTPLDMRARSVWRVVREAFRRGDEAVADVASKFPEHVEAWRNAHKSWGLDWLRKSARPEHLEAVRS